MTCTALQLARVVEILDAYRNEILTPAVVALALKLAILETNQ